MASVTDKTVKSKYPPKQTNVTWIDTSHKPTVTKSYINGKWVIVGGGGGGTKKYSDLEEKPLINGVELNGNKTSQDLGVYSKPTTGIPESDLSSDVQQALQKHFKGWYDSSSNLPANPVVGDYAYVKGASSTDPAAIYECTTAGSWSNSGRTADTSNVQTFASGEEVNEVHIVNDCFTGGADDVFSAEQGKVLKTLVDKKVNKKEPRTITTTEETYGITAEGSLGTNSDFSHTKPVFINKGSLVIAEARDDSTSLSAIAVTDLAESFYKNKIIGNNTGAKTKRFWIATQDCYISCTYRKSDGINLSVIDGYVEEVYRNLQYSYFGIYVHTLSQIDFKATMWDNTNIKNEASNSCYIDFGDGSGLQPITSSDSLKHTYSERGVYEITLIGLTGLTGNGAFGTTAVSNWYFNYMIFGESFTNVGSYYMVSGGSRNVHIPSVEFVAENPLSWNTVSINNFQNVDAIVVPSVSFPRYYDTWRYNDISNHGWLQRKLKTKGDVDYLYGDNIVTVGVGGNFATITEALGYLSQKYPLYKKGGVNARVQILSGTTISEQIYVNGVDLSWISIYQQGYVPETKDYSTVTPNIVNGTIVYGTTEGYPVVEVDASGFDDATHDTRYDVCLFRAENGGKLPQICCVFKLTTPNSTYGVAGMVCNKGSEGIVRSLCGFIGFQDGVISNNESSITIREGITMNCSRWGCHARHNGEVSARSIIAIGCATDATKASEYGAAVADRVADMDVREAYLSGNVTIRSSNASTICARATHIIGGGVSGTYQVIAEYSGKINASQMEFGNTAGEGIKVQYGGWIDAFSVTGNPTFSPETKNTVSSNGIIFG